MDGLLLGTTHKGSQNLRKCFFLQSQINKEVLAGCYSTPFGPELLPGMYSMLIHAIPKLGLKKIWLITDHSAGQFALNNNIAGVTLDNVLDLGNVLQVMCH